MRPSPTVLIIDAELGARRLVRLLLEAECYRVIGAETAKLGLEAAAEQEPDLIILDLDLPDMDGLAVLRRIRQRCQKPVLILSEHQSSTDKVTALDSGADDYLTKPFDTAELLARLRVIQRRRPGAPDSTLLVNGELQINVATHEVLIAGHKLPLTPTEEALLYLLARHAGTTVTYNNLISSVWGTDDNDTGKIQEIRVYIASLRKKLRGYGEQLAISTHGGVGYCLSLAPGLI